MTSVYIGDSLVDVWDEEPIVITKEIAPLEELTERQGDYSKTFGIVGNEKSHKVFSHFFDSNVVVTNLTSTNFNPDFNPNRKADVSVWSGDDVVFRGYLKLDSITMERDKVIYHCSAYSGLSLFGDELGEKRLRELDLSAYNHNYTNANVSGSWTAGNTNGYVYPMIKYNKTQSGNDNSWKIEDFLPSVYIKTLWDAIFDEAEWSYSSTFLTTDPFTNLIMTNGQGVMDHDSDTINDWTFTVGSSSSWSATNYKSLAGAPVAASRFEFDTDSGSLLDNTLQNTTTTEWDTTNYVYDAVDNNMRMQFRLYVDGEFDLSSSSVSPLGMYAIAEFGIVRVRGAVSTVVDSLQIDITGGTATLASTTVSLNKPVNWTTRILDVKEGDSYYIIFRGVQLGRYVFQNFVSSHSIADGNATFTADAGSLFGNILDPVVQVQNTVTLQRVLPEEMTCKEFINGVSNMFNLYFEQTEDRELLIEPRDSGFYTSTIKDYSKKRVIDREYKTIPTSELNAKEYLFTYEEDGAQMNLKYRNSWNMEYGAKRVYVDTDFQTEDKVIKPPFASSVLTNDHTVSNRVVTDIHFEDDDGLFTTQQSLPRIIYYGGMVGCSDWTYTWNGGTVTKSEYPYAGHLDNPLTPDWDFHFFQPKNIYFKRLYGGTDFPQYPNRNLYNKYYWRHIKEISSPNSRVYEGYFNLTRNEFAELSFRPLYFFDNQTWRLIEVRDFDVTGNNLTFMRFLLTDNITDPTFDRYKLKGGYGEEDDNGDYLPVGFVYKEKDNQFEDRAYEGSGNNIGAKGGVLRAADNNDVHSTADGFMLLNANDNEVRAPGAVLINTSEKTVTDYNSVWINDINLENVLEATFTSAAVTGMFSTPIQLKPEPESNQFYDVTRATLKYEHNGTNYVTAGADLNIKCGDSGLLLATQQYDPLNYSSDRNYLFAIAPTTLTAARDLDDRLGQSLELSSSQAITGNGGDVTIKFYYRLMEI